MSTGGLHREYNMKNTYIHVCVSDKKKRYKKYFERTLLWPWYVIVVDIYLILFFCDVSLLYPNRQWPRLTHSARSWYKHSDGRSGFARWDCTARISLVYNNIFAGDHLVVLHTFRFERILQSLASSGQPKLTRGLRSWTFRLHARCTELLATPEKA